MRSNLVTISAKNWEKYNPRADRDNFSWFRFQNNFYNDDKLFDLSGDERHIYLMCLCTISDTANKNTVLSMSKVASVLRLTVQFVEKTLVKLERELDLISTSILESLAPNGGVTAPSSALEESLTAPVGRPTDVTNETYVTDERIPVAHASAPIEKSLGSQAWEVYAEAYRQRWEVPPVRNAKTNALCTQLAKRLGKDALEVIPFYLKHNDGWLIKNQHDLGSLVSKAESYHTQWQRGHAVTSQQVRAFEKQTGNMDLLEKVRKGEI